MTNVTTLFGNVKLGKKIEFVEYIHIDSEDHAPLLENMRASYYDNVKLISKGDEFDIIAAWDDGVEDYDVAVFLGHWNDGIV